MPHSSVCRFATGFLATLLLVIISTVSIGAQDQKANQHVAKLEQQIEGKENLPAEEVFKNIEIMKGIPAGRLLRIMEKGFVPALGVDCSFCHVIDHWEVDEKEHKRVARKMWKMVGGINSQLKDIAGNDAQSVNCSTCHRGNEKPPGR